MFGSRKTDISFESLGPAGGVAAVGGSRLEFEIARSNACFSLEEDGSISVYSIAESIHGLNIGPLRIEIEARTQCNGQISYILAALNEVYDAYARRINEQKDAELNELIRR